MEKTIDRLNEVTKRKEEIDNKIKELKKDPIIQKYLLLQEQSDALYKEEKDLYYTYKNEEYNSCNHIFILSKSFYDNADGSSYRKCGCIKCGLDTTVLDHDRDFLPYQKKIMYDFLKANIKTIKGTIIEETIDLDLAQNIYHKIKENHPDIDDDTTITYFKEETKNNNKIKVLK